MTKNILKDYIAACTLEQELEDEIAKLEQDGRAHDVVAGSNRDYPYQEQHYQIDGVTDEYQNLDPKWEQLNRQKQKVKGLREQVDNYMLHIPARIQQVIRYKYFEGYTWDQIAAKLGGGVTAESVRKELQRFLKKN